MCQPPCSNQGTESCAFMMFGFYNVFEKRPLILLIFLVYCALLWPSWKAGVSPGGQNLWSTQCDAAGKTLGLVCGKKKSSVGAGAAMSQWDFSFLGQNLSVPNDKTVLHALHLCHDWALCSFLLFETMKDCLGQAHYGCRTIDDLHVSQSLIWTSAKHFYKIDKCHIWTLGTFHF